MPRQDSKRGIPITHAAFESAFETHIVRFGVKGLNIGDAADQLEDNEFSRLTNATHGMDYGLTSRPGMTSFATSAFGNKVHSIRRLNDAYTRDVLAGAAFTRVYGIDGHLGVGTTGAITQVDTGYSGNPLSLVPYRPPLSSQTWMFVGDKARMRKVRPDGLDLPIGLPKPVSAPTAVLDAIKRTNIADFATDGTQFWVPNAGFEFDANGQPTSTPTGVGTAVVGAAPLGTSAIYLTSNVATFSDEGYYSYWNCDHALDLSLVGGTAASDDDYIHMYLNISHPTFIEEVRFYFVCSDPFSTTVLPGTADASGANADFFVKSFVPADFSRFAAGWQSQTEAAEERRQRILRDGILHDDSTPVSTDLSRSEAADAALVADAWKELGILDVPLRRGDFMRVGTNTDSRGWDTITGLCVFVKTKADAEDVAIRVGDMYMHGGSGPDTGEPDSSQYDWRYTNYDIRTGAEGNPSDIMAEVDFKDSLRRSFTLTPAAYGDAAVRQKFYRRGGTLPTDWFYLGQNSSDGGTFSDALGDTEIEAAGSVEIDNYQPVATVDDDGNTVLNQPLPSLWGPLEDLLFGCGDPYRPGHVYFCKRGNPDSWPQDHLTEVCSPSEELMHGCLYGGQAFVFSKERLFVLYPNLSGDTTAVTAAVTQCKRGMINRWGLAVGIGGMYFVSRDGIYRTVGGDADWISKQIDTLFTGETKNGYAPIDFSVMDAIKLEVHDNELYFQYHDTDGDRQCMIYNIPFGWWRHYTFSKETACFYSDEGADVDVLVIGALSQAKVYTHDGFSDDGDDIEVDIRTGVNDFKRPREEKRLGDQILDLDSQGEQIALQNFVNDETVTNPAQVVTPAAGRTRATFDGFGVITQRARNISTHLSWASATVAPTLFQLGTSIIIEPDITLNRVTQWEDMGHADESYLTGVTFDCDTGGEDRTIIVEYDFNGLINVADTLTVNCNGRHKVKFSWTAVQAHKVRLRPDDDCMAWQLFKVDWITVAEPPRISKWDIHFENGWDQYYTGVDLYCNTFGQDKIVEVYVDEVLVKTATVNTLGRKVHHITLPWGRGHVFRFRATDDNPGLLYEYRWHTQEEPSEQTNWNQNFTVSGTEGDKFLKAIVFQCDTFGQSKTVTVECDGVVVETLTINANGRKVVQKAFPQHLGRVFRVYPTDEYPGRLYSLWWVFDQEPLALDRWETQEITHGFASWHYPIYGHVTLKSTAKVILEITAYNQSGDATPRTYVIESTEGDKRKVFVGFQPTKGVLYKYLLTSADPFWLYREETVIKVREWGNDKTLDAKPFGNEDTDPTRVMTRSELAASRGGGGTS